MWLLFIKTYLIYSSLVIKDDHRAFRRQLEDKRPIVENNLLSGRQYLATEAVLSDASDAEGNFSDEYFIGIF